MIYAIQFCHSNVTHIQFHFDGVNSTSHIESDIFELDIGSKVKMLIPSMFPVQHAVWSHCCSLVHAGSCMQHCATCTQGLLGIYLTVCLKL